MRCFGRVPGVEQCGGRSQSYKSPKMQERLWPKDRSQVRKVVEVVLNEIDRAAAFGDPNRAAAFEEKHLRDVPKFKRRADLLA
jgi:hypothetical protein